jgi:DNA-binding winged helix-turn-helix (wHTH) protein
MEDLHVPDAWLLQIGFKLGNPFSTREASREPEPELLQYFVQHPSFDDIMGDALHPKSSFLVAERGCGKTTTRRAIEWNCFAGRPNGLILPVSYVDFSIPLEAMNGNDQLTTDYHVAAILREGVPLLLEKLAQTPRNIGEFSLGFRKLLSSYLVHYTNLNTDVGLDRWLRKIGYANKKISFETLQSKNVSTKDAFLRFLIDLLALAPKQKIFKRESALDQMSKFVFLAELSGFKSVYILVDRLDEKEPMSSSSQEAAKLIEPLVTDLHLLELEKMAFKFFVTPSIMDKINEHPGFRTDRLMIRHINWSEEKLQQLLDRRVEVFTQGKLPSLDVVCEPDVIGLVSKLSSLANGSPRNMMRLAEWLLYWRHTRTLFGNEFLISNQDLENSINSFLNESKNIAKTDKNKFQSGIWIDESAYVCREAKKLGRLPELQFKLLSHLIVNKGKICTYASLRKSVYGEMVDSVEGKLGDDRIDQLIKRIRKLVEEDSKYPKYIVKVAAKGYILEE